MNIFETYKNDFLEQTQFSEVMKNIKPTTAQGTQLKRDVFEHLQRNEITFSFIDSVIASVRQIGDKSILESIADLSAKFDQERYKVGLSMIGESLQNSEKAGHLDSNLSKSLQGVVGKLISLEKADFEKSVVEGGLDTLTQQSHIARVIKNEVKTEYFKDSNHVVEEFKVYNPVCYVDESGDYKHFRIGSRVYGETDNKVFESTAPNSAFVTLTNVLEHGVYDPETKTIEFDTAIGDIKISESGINLCGKDYNIADYLHEAGKLLRVHNVQEHTDFVDQLVAVSEAFSDIKTLNHINVVENLRTKETFVISNTNENFSVGIVASGRRMPKMKNYGGNISEALKDLKYYSGYNASNRFDEPLEKEKVRVVENAERQNKIDAQVEKLDERLKRINEGLKRFPEGSTAYTQLIQAKNLVFARKKQVRES